MILYPKLFREFALSHHFHKSEKWWRKCQWFTYITHNDSLWRQTEAMIKSPNQNFLRFPHSSIHVSHIPNCTFVPYISTKSQIHFFSSLPLAGSKAFRTIAPKSRCQHGPLFAKRVELFASILPGGSWWALPELREDGVEPTTALIALRRIWELVADERWAAFVAVGSLVIAAVSVNCISYFLIRKSLYGKASSQALREKQDKTQVSP